MKKSKKAKKTGRKSIRRRVNHNNTKHNLGVYSNLCFYRNQPIRTL
jgi:hypothetical protein